MDTKSFLNTPSGVWDTRVAFSPKDIAEMLHLPLSSVSKFLREGQIETYRIGRHYRVSRQALYRFLQDNRTVCL